MPSANFIKRGSTSVANLSSSHPCSSLELLLEEQHVEHTNPKRSVTPVQKRLKNGLDSRGYATVFSKRCPEQRFWVKERLAFLRVTVEFRQNTSPLKTAFSYTLL